MKTAFILKLTIWIAILLQSLTAICQEKYLKITLSENEIVKFPPNTAFELKNENDEILFSDKDEEDLFVVNDKSVLVVYPTWKDNTDTFRMTSGKVELVDVVNYNTKEKKTKKNNKYVYNKEKYTKGITMSVSYDESLIHANLKNASFLFSNGVEARYIDGEMSATLNGEELNVRGKYFIYFQNRVIKLSYNPKNGETWWVVEDL